MGKVENTVEPGRPRKPQTWKIDLGSVFILVGQWLRFQFLDL